jgi:cardiolipin synthase
MFSENRKNELITIPNLLSLLRIALIPVYGIIYLRASSSQDYLLAGSILAFSCMTDLIDGFIARKFCMVTNIGKILDPLADKLTQLALILSLSFRYSVLYPILGLFLVKELFQCFALIFFVQKGKALSGAIPAGKCCTVILFISLTFLVLVQEVSLRFVQLLTLIDGIFLLFAFYSYFLAYFGKKNFLTDLNYEK